ncbi:sigma-70 family RNA polymerase sigma factor [Occultella glacieicola]|uniref:Sigma-70 family RNA polymerase sigma factor n=1 Tax=Occultella glacieicola TaxID=2518684 RepID=A0ABY2E6R5_9MICO|nr:sigma-70 family RNA polymerase sigma factor [Occultella glacieicola]TDE97236.1 sigma-70 family RNA polymerase sigma factor [Occultella glacieicola]
MKATPEERFESLYWTHHRELLAFIRRRTSPNVAEDILAETFVVTWRRIEEVPMEARPWLFGVARNSIRNYLRADGRQQALRIRLEQEPPEAQPDLSVAIASRADLVTAWNLLTDSEQEVIALTAWDDLSNSEAATVLGCTKSAFAVRLFRARRRLLHLLERTGTGSSRSGPRRQAQGSQS